MRNSLWREESKVLEKTPGELLIGRLARRLMIVGVHWRQQICLQAAGAACTDQLKGEGSRQAVPLMGLLLPELAV